MELMYLYIADFYSTEDRINSDRKGEAYKSLKDCGFNFSNDYTFDVKKLNAKYILNIKKKDSIRNFYDPTGKITNITGIVGKNGTGKSSLLDFIIGITKNKADFRMIEYGFIAIYRTEATDHDHKNRVVCQWNMEVDFDPHCKFTNEFKFVNITSEHTIAENLPDYKIIKYSNIFEVNNPSSITSFGNDESIIDITTTALLNDAWLIAHNTKYQNYDTRKGYKNQEVKLQAFMVCNHKNLNFDFKLPQFLRITVDLFDVEFALKDERIEEELKKVLHNIKEKVISEARNSSLIPNPKKSFLLFIHLAALFAHVRMLTPSDSFFYVEVSDMEKILSSENTIHEVKEYMRKIMKEFGDENPKIIKFLTQLESFDESLFNSFPNKALRIEINTDSFEILNNYFDAKLFSEIISFDWVYSETSIGEMSSGEKTYFSLFSRFFDIGNPNSKKYKYHLRNVIVLLDEGEYQLHPEWQRKYISWLTSFFSDIFKNTESIQIIITSHSPFILSDLRKDDVILLEKDENGISHICSLDKYDKTFGANIHNLYADTFFMNKCLMGEFAKKKIETLIKFLSIKKPIDKKKGLDEKSSQLLIKEIGEPVLREHLQNLWNEKYPSDEENKSLEQMAKRIAELEIENKKLKNETNRNS